MIKKIKTIAVSAMICGGLAVASATPTSAFSFSGFNFGMDNNGPFMMLSDGPEFWHFNMFHPFGRYGNRYNRNRFGGFTNNPWTRFYGSGNRYGSGHNPWSRGITPWQGNQFGGSPWSGASPWGSGMRPWGGSPWGGAPFGGSPFGGSPFGGSPFGGSPWGGGPSWNPVTGISPFGSPFGGFRPF